MLRSYIISTIRNFSRQKLFVFINIAGLAIALATVMLIFLQTKNELSYDRFHSNINNIYRVEEDQLYNNELYHVNVTPWPSGPVWQEEIPEVEMATRYTNMGSILFKYKDYAFYESKVYAADSTFFKMFSFELKEGHPEHVLKNPQSIVISEEIADKYFKDTPAIGKVLNLNNSNNFEVTGVFKKIPGNSSIEFNALVSFDFARNSPWYSEHWGSNSIQTFLSLNDKADINTVNDKLTAIVDQHFENNTTSFMVAPLKKMHLYSYFGYSKSHRGIETVFIFIAVGLFVLVIASINFMNLTTAKSTTRAKEIGVRKINGAHQKNLLTQFLSESIITVMIAVFFGFIISSFLLGPFNRMIGKNYNLSDLFDPVFLLGVLVLTLVTGLLSGLYPSVILSSMKPLNIIKTRSFKDSGKGWFRKISVIIQFSLGIILIIGTIIIYQQLRYMQNKELGYDKNNLLYIPLRGELREEYSGLKEELKKLPEVDNISSSSHPPYYIGSNSSSIDWAGKDPDMDALVSFAGVDFDYAETLKIQMKSGRSHSRDFGSDYFRDTLTSFMINEEMKKLMGVGDPVGMQLEFNGLTGEIVGVMANYHYQSARQNIEPLALAIAPKEYINYMIIKLNDGDLSENLKKLEEGWNNIMPQYPFDYHFVDQDFENMYNLEERMGALMKALAIIAVIIASVGLFGLSAFSAEQKTKEIGIRKAMGASTRNILALFSREFLVLLVVSAIISWPLSWYFLKNWLQGFDYRIEMKTWVFFGAALLSLLIAMIAITYHSYRAAIRNPADTLRYE